MIKKSQICFIDEVFDQEKKEDNNMHIPSQTPPKTPKGGSSAERNDKITIDVEAKGLEELTEQAEDLRDAISTAPRVLIKNPRDCTITVDASEYNSKQSELETERCEVIKLEKLREQLCLIMRGCRSRDDCDGCPIKRVCEKGGAHFLPYEWDFGE